MRIHILAAAAIVFGLLASATVYAESQDISVTSWLDKGNGKEREYRKIKASLIRDNAVVPFSIDRRMTAKGMIGRAIFNESDERVATVKDIILDKEGAARMIIVKDAKFDGPDMRRGLAAFDYAAIVNITAEGDFIAPITPKSMKSVAAFSYESADEAEGKFHIIPENGYSIEKLLEGELIDAEGRKITDIENIGFSNGRASVVFAAFNRVLNMGGDMAAVDFNAAGLLRDPDKDEVDIMLDAATSTKLKTLMASSS